MEPVVVVANAVLPRARHLVTRLLRRAAELALSSPIVEWTTPVDGGFERASAALARGAEVVVACGGDGTVRRVAAAVAGTGKDLAILPAGRANVAAFNLGISRRTGRRQLDRILLGDARPCDAVEITYRLVSGEQRSEMFVSMAGLGYDAAAIHGMRGGGRWLPYFTAGSRYLRAEHVELEVMTSNQRLSGAAWSVFIGNLAQVPPGIQLFAGAGPDSHELVTAVVRPPGYAEWVSVAAGRLLRGRSDPYYSFRRAPWVEVAPRNPLPLQLDGDVIPEVAWLRAVVLPGALRVRG